ncbi:DUF4145 domain-containing protein [Azohydromonas lata]|uniref:DUF4145 domain-containing protein n=1 Tax=Azohydromonas lata TaxID=45677 RepID=A0ABU5I9S4_9BURK|nr:DUF4145 domain-containing protein [Azohydromonas lata]MDZ5455662.1 DUF4145 domain-containing protein [Azohydromonas lata]
MAVSAIEEASNFSFLKQPPHQPPLFSLASSAEQHYANDPNTCLLKLRQFGEAVARHLFALAGIEEDARGSKQIDRLAEVQRRDFIDRDIAGLLHLLRKEGNAAAHDFVGEQRDALAALRVGRQLAIWFPRAFGFPPGGFKPGPFVEPLDAQLQAGNIGPGNIQTLGAIGPRSPRLYS